MSEDGRNSADESIKWLVRNTLGRTGLIEYDTEEGVFRFVSDSSKYGQDLDDGNVLTQALGYLNAAVAFGSRLYQNYTTTRQQIEGIIDCFGNYKTYLEYTDGNSAKKKQELAVTNPEAFRRLYEADYEADKVRLRNSADFMDRAGNLLNDINKIIDARAKDPSLEPIFTSEAADLLKNTGFKVGSEEFRRQEEEIFRLVFGPPKSKNGQFLLSVDGLYYDSQSTSGITKALNKITSLKGKLKKETRWKFDYDPNLGGRGTQISDKELSKYIGTLFDENNIDNSKFLQEYYEKDHFLQQLEGQKNKRISDITRQAEELEDDPTSPVSLRINSRQAIISEASTFESKIRRRKKQIEIAVKAPSIYGGGALFVPGKIPINDFSYLQEFNFSVGLESQKKLVLDQAEVSGVVLPIKAKFVVSPSNNKQQILEHLLVPDIGAGAMIVDGFSASSTSGLILDYTDNITTDGLFAIYNYLDTFIESPSSNKYKTTNCSNEEGKNYCKLVSKSTDHVFASGLGIAYLGGITEHSSTSPTTVSGYNSFAIMPESPEFLDWTYSREGFTFESWIHMPGLNQWNKWGYTSSDASGLYRLILANENFGIANGITPGTDVTNVKPVRGEDYVRGMVIGFTRDVRFVKNQYPSNDHYTQDPVYGLNFVIAPTQSISSSAIAFTNKTDVDAYGCGSTSYYHGWSMATSDAGENGAKFNWSCYEFCLLSISVKPEDNTVKVYLDGNLMGTSSISTVFGTEDFKPPNIPNFTKGNSFNYKNTSLGGPELGRYTTPWVLGGGYTDGASGLGNFMGGEYGGIRSGLRGFLGSTKFYSKALSQSQIVNNYNLQKDFFKNVEVDITCFDPIEVGTWGP